jgi:GMP synthase (glutamine-hydrolysing)
VPRLLLVKAGTAHAAVRIAFGDYDRWFRRALRACGPVDVRVAEAHLGAPLPTREEVDGVIVTGSPLSVLDRAPWMRDAGRWLLAAADARVPVLGVCFGHQLLAEALGGAVRRSPGVREIGTISCTLTEAGRADPLFAGVPERFEVQATHGDEVDPAPAGAVPLASNARSVWQAFRAGPFLAGVQFHPEVDAATMSAMIEARREGLEAEARARGEDPRARLRGLRAGIRATPAGERILANFVAAIRR